MPNADNKTRYIEFVNKFFPQHYDSEALYRDLRCKLVPCYSLGPDYVFHHNLPDMHFEKNLCGQTMLNMENFIDELEGAMNKYFSFLDKDNEVCQNAIEKVKKDGIMGIVKSRYLRTTPSKYKIPRDKKATDGG